MSAREEREAILARVLAGDLREDESPARELLQESEDARRELAELRALELALGDSHAERDEILSETRAQADTSDEDELVDSFRTIAHSLPALSRDDAGTKNNRTQPLWPERPPLIPLLVGIAALVLAMIWLGPRYFGDSPRQPQVLGNGAECTEPIGAVSAYGVFAWESELPVNGSWELKLYAVEADGALTEVLRVPDLFEPTWTYDPGRDPELPAHIQWKVIVLDGLGAPNSQSGQSEAWLP